MEATIGAEVSLKRRACQGFAWLRRHCSTPYLTANGCAGRELRTQLGARAAPCRTTPNHATSCRFRVQDIATSPRSKLSAVPDMFLQLAISFIRSAIRKRAKFDIRDVRLAALSSWDSARDASYGGPNK